MQRKISSSSRLIDQFTVEDNLDSLNAALEVRNIGADAIVSIVPMPAITPAIGDWTAKLRVIYRS